MAVADRARFLVRQGCVAVGDVRLKHERAELYARVEDIAGTSLTSLVNATRQLRATIGEDVTLLRLYEGVPPASFWPSFWPALPVTISIFGEDQVRISLAMWPDYLLDEPGAGAFSALEGFAARHRVHVGSVGLPSVSNRGAFEPSLAVPPRGRTVGDCLALAEDARLVLDAVLATGAFDRAAVADLLRAKRPDLLIGLRECPWFDAKVTPYILRNDGDRFEFAKDVAAFGNAKGGLIVCGLRTGRDEQGDIVRDVRPFDFALTSRPALQKVLRDWIHPTPGGVRIELLETVGLGRGVMLVEIPPQPSHVKPLLIARAELGGRLSTMQISLPVRDGEETDYASIGEIHALLVADRVALAADRQDGSPDDADA